MTQKALKFRKILLKQSKLTVLPMPQEDKHFANTLNNLEIELASRWWTPHYSHQLNQFIKKSITNLPQKLFLWTMKNQLVLTTPVQTWPSSTTWSISQHTRSSSSTSKATRNGARSCSPPNVTKRSLLPPRLGMSSTRLSTHRSTSTSRLWWTSSRRLSPTRGQIRSLSC